MDQTLAQEREQQLLAANELAVRDNGIGMAKDQSLDGSLGLRIVASLAQQLGGSARVETAHGTAWFVTFPGGGLGDASPG